VGEGKSLANVALDASPNDYYLQELIIGEACAAIYVADGKSAAMLGASRQLIGAEWTGATGYHYAGSIGPLELTPSQDATFRRIGDSLAHEFGLVGLFGVDAILDAQGEIWPLEVNPRYTASVEILERATGARAIAAHLEACLHGRLSALPAPSGAFSGKAILYARRTIAVSDDFPTYAAKRNAGRMFPEIGDVPHAGQTIRARHPVATALADGASLADVESQLRQRIAELQGRLGC
jgi:predicted ATP-grasp superfamily ATP-dependent carboligase